MYFLSVYGDGVTASRLPSSFYQHRTLCVLAERQRQRTSATATGPDAEATDLILLCVLAERSDSAPPRQRQVQMKVHETKSLRALCASA